MKWHDGKPVTIEDASFSLEAPGYGDKAPMYKPFVANIAKVETTGPTELCHQAEDVPTRPSWSARCPS